MAPGPSADAVVPWLFSSRSPVNVARIGSSAVEVLLDQASMTANDDERWDLLGDAQRTALLEGLILPVSVSTSTLARAPQSAALEVRPDGSLDLVSSLDQGR